MDKTIKIWDYEQRRLLKVIDREKNSGHSTSVNKVHWSDINNWLLSTGDDRTIAVWEVNVTD